MKSQAEALGDSLGEEPQQEVQTRTPHIQAEYNFIIFKQNIGCNRNRDLFNGYEQSLGNVKQ